jgi:hypothetical protein
VLAREHKQCAIFAKTQNCPRASARHVSQDRFDAANQGAVALNRKFIDIAQRNINSSFDLAKSLAGAKNLAEAMELQSTY